MQCQIDRNKRLIYEPNAGRFAFTEAEKCRDGFVQHLLKTTEVSTMTKEELITKIKAELGELEVRFEQLKQKAAEETHELENDFQETIVDLGDKIDQAKAKCSEIADTADDQWEELKDSLEAGWNEKKNLLDEAWGNLSDSFAGFFSESTKEEFLRKAQKTINSQLAKLDQLKQKAKESADDLAKESQKAIDVLESQIEEAKANCQEIADIADHRWDYMKSSAEKGWDETKSKLESGWDSLNDSVKKLFS